MNYERIGGRIPLDPRAVDKIARSPAMSREQQGGGYLQSWGGPDVYRALAQLPRDPRLVFAAALEGVPEDQIEVVTGLSDKEVAAALTYLRQKGLVAKEPV